MISIEVKHFSSLFQLFSGTKNKPMFGKVQYVSRFYKRFLMSVLLQESIISLTWITGILLFLLLISLLSFGESLRLIMLSTFLVSNAVILVRFVRRINKLSHLEIFCRVLQVKSTIFRDLLNAIELSRTTSEIGISDELKEKLTDSVENILRNENPQNWITFESTKVQLIHFLLLCGIMGALIFIPPHLAVSGWNRLVFGPQRDLFRSLTITPQGGRVSYGDSVNVTVELLEVDHPLPKLFVKISGGWDEVSSELSGRKSLFKLSSITEEVRFKVRWSNIDSPTYLFIPYDPPRLKDFTVRKVFPSYLGLNPQVVKGEPQIHVFRGTKIEIEASSTKELKRIELVTGIGTRYPVKLQHGKKIFADFIVQNPFQFWFDMEDREGINPTHPVLYNVQIKEDASPRIRLLAPASDLIVGKESVIPFTYEIEDDVGITSLYLKIERSENPQFRKFLLKKYTPVVLDKIDSSDFSFGSIKTRSGETMKMQLEVQDNDLVTGPKSGFSQTILVEIRSYEKEHAQINEEIKEVGKDLLELLSEQTLARIAAEEWRSLAQTPDQLNKKIEDSMKKQSDINSKAEKIEKKLEKTLDKMDRDPLSDFSVWNEYKAIEDGLQSVRQGAMESAKQSFQEKKWESATSQQDQVISELERLSSLSENIEKYGKMKDLMHSADMLQEKGQKLNDSVSSGKPVDRELMQTLQETLQEAFEILSQIQKQIQEMPQELPEDFINQPSVKELNINEMNQAADQLNQALKQGDIQAAIRAAQDLLRQAKAARDTLSKAAENVPMPSGGDLSANLGKKENVLQKIIDQQENVLQKTDILESKRQQYHLSLQKKLLSELAERQKKVMDESNGILTQVNQHTPRAPFSDSVTNAVNAALPRMQDVLKEFEKKNVIFSHKWLKEIIGSLDSGVRPIENYFSVHRSTSITAEILAEVSFSSDVGNKLKFTQTEEQTILELLKKAPETGDKAFNNEDRNQLSQLSQEQESLEQETKKLRNEISELASNSAIISSEVMDSLKSAQSEMKSAEKSLGEARTESAQGQEQKALSHLRKGQEKMQQIQQQLGKMKQAGGQKQTGFIQNRASSQSGGYTGFKIGEVRIPTADEYLPPREFREEILESLKERYPKAQESAIKDYYKKLSR